MLRRIVVLRHGRTGWNAERRYQGQADPPLDEVGQAQAVEVAALVAAMRPDLLISSDLARARQTAEQVANLSGVPVRQDVRLRERHLGHWQGLTRDEVAARYPDEFADWLAGRDVTRRGGESRKQVAERALELVDELPEVPSDGAGQPRRDRDVPVRGVAGPAADAVHPGAAGQLPLDRTARRRHRLDAAGAQRRTTRPGDPAAGTRRATTPTPRPDGRRGTDAARLAEPSG